MADKCMYKRNSKVERGKIPLVYHARLQKRSAQDTKTQSTLYSLQGVQAQTNKISKMFSSYRPCLSHVATQAVQSMRPRFTDFLLTFEHISPDVDQLSFEICARLSHHIKSKVYLFESCFRQ